MSRGTPPTLSGRSKVHVTIALLAFLNLAVFTGKTLWRAM